MKKNIFLRVVTSLSVLAFSCSNAPVYEAQACFWNQNFQPQNTSYFNGWQSPYFSFFQDNYQFGGWGFYPSMNQTSALTAFAMWPASMTYERTDTQGVIMNITNSGYGSYSIQAYASDIRLEKGAEYELSFDYCSTKDAKTSFQVQQNYGNNRSFLSDTINMTSTLQHYETKFTATKTERSCSFSVRLGDAAFAGSTVTIDNFKLNKIQDGTSVTPTITVKPNVTPTVTVRPTTAPTVTVKPTATPTATVKPTVTPTVTVRPTAVPTSTVRPTTTPTVTVRPTAIPTTTVKPTITPTSTVKPTAAPTVTTAPDYSNLKVDDFDLTVSNKDKNATYDESTSCNISFTNSGVTVNGTGATATGTTLTITEKGTYILSGTCSDGQVIVDINEDDKVQIVLNNLTLASKSSSPFIIKQTDKAILTLANNSKNTISDASSYETVIDDTTIDAAIFSKEDLSINGDGTLTVNGNYKHGIVSKDDFVVTGGTLNVTSAKTGLEGKDSVRLFGGNITINAGTDGVRSTNDKDASKGFVCINGATLNVTSKTDAVQAVTLLYVADGKIQITSGGGSNNASHTSNNNSWYGFGTQPTTDSTSTKGFKSTYLMYLVGGTTNINSADDAIHSNGSIVIDGGNYTLLSGDDGVHADIALTINKGTVTILTSYEGLESGIITINGGDIYVVSSDDGLNAAGTTTTTNYGRMGQFDSDSSKKIFINGGYLVVNASGDGLDSNGSITVTGGVTLVSGPTNNGNGALDCGTGATISGGIVIACGSSGMAESFNTSSTQGCIKTNITTQSANKTIALCDSNGNVLASFTPMKQYQNIVVSTPDIKQNNTYTICTGTVTGADSYGFTTSGTLTNRTQLVSVNMTSLNYGSSNGGFNQGGFRW